jgi:hypothetical protein
MSIKARRSALRYISSGPSIGRGVNSPISQELGFTPFRLLGPPEVPRSAFFVNSFPDDDKIISRSQLIELVDHEVENDPEDETEDETEDESEDENPIDIFDTCYFKGKRGTGEDPCYIFLRKCINKKGPLSPSGDELLHYLELSWRHCRQTTLKLICLLKNTTHLSKGNREDFYTVAMWLHHHHPETLAYNVRAFARFGCLKDLLEILYRIVNGPHIRHNQLMARMRVRRERRKKGLTAKRKRKQRKIIIIKSKVMQLRTKEEMQLRNEKGIMRTKKAIESYNYDPKYRFLHDQISNLFVELLKADLEHLISGQLAKISLASKWCPSLDSSYDRSTLFCESVARKLFPRDACPEYREIDEAHYAYRVRDRLRKQVLVPLRRALELPEIYMSANQWNLIQYDRITSSAMKNYKSLFYKHDQHRFSQHLLTVKSRPKTTDKDVLPYEILRCFEPFHYHPSHASHEVAELQWKRMIDTYCSKGKFVNCITVVNDFLFCQGFGSAERFCIAFALMTSELCASPWRGKILTYSTKPEFVNIEGDDLGSRVSFLRFRSPWDCMPYQDLRLVMDKILETAIDLKLAKEDMFERVFVFDRHLAWCDSINWEKDYGPMQEKYKRNGYVMPEILRWYCHCNDGAPRISVGTKSGLTKIYDGGAEEGFRSFLESDGIFSSTVVMESKICGEDYLKLVLRD